MNLIFIDLETNGLDQNAPGAELLELALVASCGQGGVAS